MTDNIDDAARAKTGINDFKVTKQQLIDVIECYRQRKYVEELSYITDKLGSVESILQALNVDPEHGITADSLEARKAAFGDHTKERPERTPFCTLIWESLQDFMLQVLLVCAFVSIVIEMSFADPSHRSSAWIEGFAIFMAVAVVSLVTAGSDYKKEGQFLAQLNIDMDSQVVKVLRHGVEEELHRDHLKVGDIIKI